MWFVKNVKKVNGSYPTVVDSFPADNQSSISEQKLKSLTKAKVTRPLVYERLYEGLNAVKRYVDADDKGDPVLREEPDLLIRHKYLDTALRVFGDLKPDGVQVGVGVNVGLSSGERELLEAYKREK